MAARSPLTWGLCLALAWASPVSCEPPPAAGKKGPIRTDRYGDSLPNAAFARLGTRRFRPGGQVKAAAFSPDGKVLASTVGERTIDLWEAATGKRLRRIDAGSWGIKSFAFSPDGTTLASGGVTVSLWEPSTGRK